MLREYGLTRKAAESLRTSMDQRSFYHETKIAALDHGLADLDGKIAKLETARPDSGGDPIQHAGKPTALPSPEPPPAPASTPPAQNSPAEPRAPSAPVEAGSDNPANGLFEPLMPAKKKTNLVAAQPAGGKAPPGLSRASSTAYADDKGKRSFRDGNNRRASQLRLEGTESEESGPGSSPGTAVANEEPMKQLVLTSPLVAGSSKNAVTPPTRTPASADQAAIGYGSEAAAPSSVPFRSQETKDRNAASSSAVFKQRFH